MGEPSFDVKPCQTNEIFHVLKVKSTDTILMLFQLFKEHQMEWMKNPKKAALKMPDLILNKAHFWSH